MASTASIKEVLTDVCQEELTTIAKKISTISRRSDRANYFSIAMETVSFETKKVLDLMIQKGEQHVKLATSVLAQLQTAAAASQPGVANDSLDFFILGMKFDCGLGESCDGNTCLIQSVYEGVSGGADDALSLVINLMCWSVLSCNGSVCLGDVTACLERFAAVQASFDKGKSLDLLATHEELVNNEWKKLFAS